MKQVAGELVCLISDPLPLLLNYKYSEMTSKYSQIGFFFFIGHSKQIQN